MTSSCAESKLFGYAAAVCVLQNKRTFLLTYRAHNFTAANGKNQKLVEENCLQIATRAKPPASLPGAYSSNVPPLTIHLFQNRSPCHCTQVVEIPHPLPTLICIRRCRHQNIQDSATKYLYGSIQNWVLQTSAFHWIRNKEYGKKNPQHSLFLNEQTVTAANGNALS